MSVAPTTTLFRRRSRRSDHFLRADDGVTIVEIMIASFILGLGVVGVASLLVTTARASESVAAQNDASALATSELEIIRSYRYEYVGIDSSSRGYVREVDGRPTVTEEDSNLVVPLEKVEVGDEVYVIERSVTWEKIGANEMAYKIVRVTVSWEFDGTPRSVVVQTGLHEGLPGA